MQAIVQLQSFQALFYPTIPSICIIAVILGIQKNLDRKYTNFTPDEMFVTRQNESTSTIAQNGDCFKCIMCRPYQLLLCVVWAGWHGAIQLFDTTLQLIQKYLVPRLRQTMSLARLTEICCIRLLFHFKFMSTPSLMLHTQLHRPMFLVIVKYLRQPPSITVLTVLRVIDV